MTRLCALLCFLSLKSVTGYYYDNETEPATRQLLDFKLQHPKPIGLLTVGSGSPVEIRDMISINSDLFRDEFFFDSQAHLDGERIPERVVQSKGSGAWGYFEVTHDVSEYTKADVFNEVGKRTPALVRFGVGYPGRGGTEVFRDLKSMAVKLYTKEGNLDILTNNAPVFTFKDPLFFPVFVHTFRREPVTNLNDFTMKWDSATLRPEALTVFLFLMSDNGIPNGYTRAEYHPLHTFELNNKHGDRWYARFHFRPEGGRQFLTSEEAERIQGRDLDYYTRSLYNNIANKHYPAFRLDMDLLSLKDIQTVDYDPFDVTRSWRNGTFHTVAIGRLVLNRNPDNHFRDIELAAFNPSSLVPGIPGPVDSLFRGRRFAYRDTQNHRLGRNHLRVGVNAPLYQKSYKRDGQPPVGDNERDAPNYFPNSFNGPLPYVDDERPKEVLRVLGSNAVDLQEASNFYNYVLPDNGARQRLAENIATTLVRTTEPARGRAFKLLRLTDKDLHRRVVQAYKARIMTENMNEHNYYH